MGQASTENLLEKEEVGQQGSIKCENGLAGLMSTSGAGSRNVGNLTLGKESGQAGVDKLRIHSEFQQLPEKENIFREEIQNRNCLPQVLQNMMKSEILGSSAMESKLFQTLLHGDQSKLASVLPATSTYDPEMK